MNVGPSRLNLPHHFGLASLSATPHIPEDLLIIWGGHLVISLVPDERRFRKQTDVNLASGSSCCSPAGQHGIDFEVSGLSSGTMVLNAHFSRLSEILIMATHAEHLAYHGINKQLSRQSSPKGSPVRCVTIHIPVQEKDVFVFMCLFVTLFVKKLLNCLSRDSCKVGHVWQRKDRAVVPLSLSEPACSS